MKFPNKPIFGTLVKRYKRFFSDVKVENDIVVAHTANTGPMTTCWEEGMDCVLSPASNPDRKLKFTLELTKNDKTYILVNTHLPNKIVHETLLKKEVPELIFDKIIPEFKIEDSRFDFYAEKENKKYLIEVKNVSTKKDEFAIFPDTRSERALKHTLTLTSLQEKGYECIIIFFIGRNDCENFRPAKEIMKDYFDACKNAKNKGVLLLALEYKISPEEIKFDKKIPVII
jgi:sugar fermentation stimulation protein A